MKDATYRRRIAELHLRAARRSLALAKQAKRERWEIESWRGKVDGWKKLLAWRRKEEHYVR